MSPEEVAKQLSPGAPVGSGDDHRRDPDRRRPRRDVVGADATGSASRVADCPACAGDATFDAHTHRSRGTPMTDPQNPNVPRPPASPRLSPRRPRTRPPPGVRRRRQPAYGQPRQPAYAPPPPPAPRTARRPQADDPGQDARHRRASSSSFFVQLVGADPRHRRPRAEPEGRAQERLRRSRRSSSARCCSCSASSSRSSSSPLVGAAAATRSRQAVRRVRHRNARDQRASPSTAASPRRRDGERGHERAPRAVARRRRPVSRGCGSASSARRCRRCRR